VGGFIAVVVGAVTAVLNNHRKPAAEETADATGNHAADTASEGRVEQPVTSAEAEATQVD
jgi:hypothetical protein